MSNHNPKFIYDCENCKFNWCCGYTCWCVISNQKGLIPTPYKRKIDVVEAEKKAGCSLSFNLKTRRWNRYVEGLAMTCDECSKKSASKILWKDKHGNYWCPDCWPY